MALDAAAKESVDDWVASPLSAKLGDGYPWKKTRKSRFLQKVHCAVILKVTLNFHNIFWVSESMKYQTSVSESDWNVITIVHFNLTETWDLLASREKHCDVLSFKRPAGKVKCLSTGKVRDHSTPVYARAQKWRNKSYSHNDFIIWGFIKCFHLMLSWSLISVDFPIQISAPSSPFSSSTVLVISTAPIVYTFFRSTLHQGSDCEVVSVQDPLW